MIINAGRGIVSVMAVLGDTQLHIVTPEGKKEKNNNFINYKNYTMVYLVASKLVLSLIATLLE